MTPQHRYFLIGGIAQRRSIEIPSRLLDGLIESVDAAGVRSAHFFGDVILPQANAELSLFPEREGCAVIDPVL
jgi:hypothetical protein